MPLRFIFRIFMSHLPADKLIHKLSESYPIRQAAKLTVYIFNRGKNIAEEKIEKVSTADLERLRAVQSLKKFLDNVKQEMKSIQEKEGKK